MVKILEEDIKQWDELSDSAARDVYMPEPDPDPFGGWLSSSEMNRLADAITSLRHMIKCEQGVRNLGGGFCTLDVLEVTDSGVMLGAQFGLSDGHSRSVQWDTCEVPKSWLIDPEDNLAEKIYYKTPWECVGVVNKQSKHIKDGEDRDGDYWPTYQEILEDLNQRIQQHLSATPTRQPRQVKPCGPETTNSEK